MKTRPTPPGMRLLPASNPAKTLVPFAAALMANVVPAVAAPIPIPNPGFEAIQRAEGVDDYNKWAATQDVWRHWYRTENGGPLRIWNPGVSGTGFQGVQSYGFGGSAPEGNMVVHVRSRYADLATVVPPQWDGANYFCAAAQLLDGSTPTTAAPFDPTKIYTLTATVGKPPVFQNSYTAGQPQYDTDPLRPQGAIWHGYALQLAAGGTNQTGATYAGRVDGGTVVAQDSNTYTVPLDGYRTVTTTYFPNPADAGLSGQFLQVRLCAMDNPADLTMTGTVVFDDVKLEGFAAPTAAYWDLNDTADGAGGATPSGTWDAANTYWNATADGTGGTVAWTAGQTAVFAAGGDATGGYTVTVDGTQAIGGLAFEEGTVTLTGGTALQLTGIAMADVAGGATATIATAITEDAAGRQLAKSGTGTLVLSGANSYSGGTTVLDGILRLGAGDVLHDSSPVTVSGRASGATTLDLADNNDTIGGLVLGGYATDTSALVSTGTGTLTLGGDVAFVNAFGSGVNPLGATITGKLDLGAAARTFQVNNSATAADDLTVSADLSGSVMMTKAGKGRMVLSGNNAGATGGMTIIEGDVRFESVAAINGTARDVTVATPGAVAFGPSFGAGNIAAALTDRIVSSSDGVIAADNYAATSFDFGAAGLTAAFLGALGDVSYSGTVTPSGTTYRLGGGGGTLTMANTNAVTGAGNSLVIGGKVTLAAANDHDGGTTLLGGTVFPGGPVVLALGHDGALGSGPLTFQPQANAATCGVIQSADSSARNLANALVIGANVNTGGTGDITFTDTSVTALGATRTFTIGNPLTEFAQSFDGASFGITKAGVGLMVLSGDNTYTGLTSITAGSLTLSGDNTAASGGVTLNSAAGALNVNSATALGTGTVTLTAGTIDNTSGSALVLSGNNPVTLGGNIAFSTTAGTNSNNLTFGTGAITNGGSRTITLNGTETTLAFGGVMTNTANAVQTTTVNGTGNSLVLGGYALSNNATSRINVITGSANVTITGAVTNGGTATASGLTYSGSGTLTLNGDNTYAGATTVNTGATLALVGGSQTSAITVNNGAFLAFTPGSPTTSTKAVTLIAGAKIKLNSAPSGSSVLLTTTATITGTPVLDVPLAGYELVVEGGNTLKLNATSPYAGWSTSNAGGGLADADYDNDGVKNGVEYFMNVTVPGFTASPAMVGNTITWTNGGNIPSTDYGTQFVVQTSGDLVNWTDVDAADPNLSNTGAAVAYTLTGATKSFARLKVTPN